MESSLLFAFKDSSSSFTNGVEIGRMLAKMEIGNTVVDNCGFPVHIDNKDVILSMCKSYGYTPVFGKEYYNEWVEFRAFKLSKN